MNSLSKSDVFGLTIRWDGQVVRVLDGSRVVEEFKCRSAKKALKAIIRLENRMFYDAYRMAR